MYKKSTGNHVVFNLIFAPRSYFVFLIAFNLSEEVVVTSDDFTAVFTNFGRYANDAGAKQQNKVWLQSLQLQ